MSKKPSLLLLRLPAKNHGRSVWEINLADVSVPPKPATSYPDDVTLGDSNNPARPYHLDDVVAVHQRADALGVHLLRRIAPGVIPGLAGGIGVARQGPALDMLAARGDPQQLRRFRSERREHVAHARAIELRGRRAVLAFRIG